MKRILFFTKYTRIGPSSRYRTYQYLDFYHNFDIKVFPFFDSKYVSGIRFNYVYVFSRYLKRVLDIFKIKKNDIIFLEYEFMPYMIFNSFLFRALKIKYVVDYDDAIFHNYDQHSNWFLRFFLKKKIPKVIEHANFVVTGSPYLTRFAKKYNKNVVELPTSIDFRKYDVRYVGSEDRFIIGWIGSMSTSINLISLLPVFNRLKKENIDFKIHLIGFNKTLEERFVNLPVEFIEWRSETEVVEIKKFSVGIMPLEHTLFNRGKCAFKLIQYMACGIPTISTPLEANIKVNQNNGNLFANTSEEWYQSFLKIYKNKSDFKEIGGRNVINVKNNYSIQSNYKKYLELFNKF